MKIAIVSGKGGTGKTSLSVSLALVSGNAALIDCDVEEPNAHLFVQPEIISTEEIRTGHPVIDNGLCIHCRKCADFCRFNAIVSGPEVTFPLIEMCHDCGGCKLICPVGAINYNSRKIGDMYRGKALNIPLFSYGELHPGELSGVRIINRVKESVERERLVLIDSPPGTSCSTVAALEDADYAVIVSEPTPFGVSDMKMVVELFRRMEFPHSIVINKAGLGDDEIYAYCRDEGIEIAGEIPFDREIAVAYSEGVPPALGKNQEYYSLFEGIWQHIIAAVGEPL